jgi:hypothetical protein
LALALGGFRRFVLREEQFEAFSKAAKRVESLGPKLGQPTLEQLLEDLKPCVAAAMGVSEFPSMNVVWVSNGDELAAEARRRGAGKISDCFAHGGVSGAFVDRKTGDLVLRSDMTMRDALFILTHELVHVLQLPHLTALRAALRQQPLEEDQEILLHAVLEGQAQAVASVVLGAWAQDAPGSRGRNLARLGEAAGHVWTWEVEQSLLAAKASAPTREALQLAYESGAALAVALQRRGDAAAQQLFSRPPMSVNELVDPQLYLSLLERPEVPPGFFASFHAAPNSRLERANRLGPECATHPGDPDAKGWRAGCEEELSTEEGDRITAQALLFATPQDAQRYVAWRTGVEAPVAPGRYELPREHSDTPTSVSLRGNCVAVLVDCPPEHLSELEDRALHAWPAQETQAQDVSGERESRA